MHGNQRLWYYLDQNVLVVVRLKKYIPSEWFSYSGWSWLISYCKQVGEGVGGLENHVHCFCFNLILAINFSQILSLCACKQTHFYVCGI